MDTYFLVATVVAVLVRRSVTLLAARDGLSGELTAGCRLEPERRGCWERARVCGRLSPSKLLKI